MQKIKISLLCLLLMSLVSCTMHGVDNNVVETGLNNKCLEPLFNSSFPVGDEAFAAIATATLDPSILAPSAWQRLAEFPSLNGEIINMFLASIEDDNQLIWVTGKEADDTKIWTYDVNNKLWTSGPTVSKSAELFLDNIGNVWIHEHLHEKPSSLYRLNKETMTIEPESEKNKSFSEHSFSHYATTHDGKLWLILSTTGFQDQLYLYDPSTLELTEHLTPNYYIGLEIDGEGDVFLVIKNGIIQLYDPKSGEINERNIDSSNGPLHPQSIGVLITESNELWLSDVEKFQISNKKFTNPEVILRSPIFVTWQYSGYQPLTWERPNPQIETEDGRIWYKSNRGLAWHQPETGEWCMFTSAKSNIIKDRQGNLWIVYDNALYMLPASETSKQE